MPFLLDRQKNATHSTQKNAWWADDRPLISPVFRDDFCRTVLWAIGATPRKILLRSVQMDSEPIGVRVAIHAAINATRCRPVSQTPHDWLIACEKWRMRNLGQTNRQMPPMPWGRRGANEDELRHILNMHYVTIGELSIDAMANGCDRYSELVA